jgi:hypothetical protein
MCSFSISEKTQVLIFGQRCFTSYQLFILFSRCGNQEHLNIFLNFLQVRKSSTAIQEKGFNFDDHRLMRGAWRNEPNSDTCKVAF